MVEPEAAWQELLERLESQGKVVASWPTTDPAPDAPRCEFSRHRTLAHLRACQETWLEAIQMAAGKDNIRMVRPHPWRLFTDHDYQLIPWNEHLKKYVADRATWLELVNLPNLDLNRGGKLSRKPFTIAALTDVLQRHELHHMTVLRSP